MTIRKQSKTYIPLVFIGLMFFAIGFALGINSFLIQVINVTLRVSSAYANLVIAATFSTFIIFAYPASKTIKKIAYKHTMSLSLLIFNMILIQFQMPIVLSSFGAMRRLSGKVTTWLAMFH